MHFVADAVQRGAATTWQRANAIDVLEGRGQRSCAMCRVSCVRGFPPSALSQRRRLEVAARARRRWRRGARKAEKQEEEGKGEERVDEGTIERKKDRSSGHRKEGKRIEGGGKKKEICRANSRAR